LFYSISTKHFAGYLIRFSVLPEATFAPRSQITPELRPMNSLNPRLIFPLHTWNVNVWKTDNRSNSGEWI